MKILGKEVAYNGHFKVIKYLVELIGGKQMHQECFERGESVAALIFDEKKQKFIFTRQDRIGSQSSMLEIMAGSMDKEGEEPVDALKRELTEELGYVLSKDSDIEHIVSYYVSPGGTSEKVHIYFATVTEKVSEGGGVEDENIEIVEMTSEEVFAYLPQINDAKTYTAIMWMMNKSLLTTFEDAAPSEAK